jgi:rhomboid family GlyGly-CTERM serine protease
MISYHSSHQYAFTEVDRTRVKMTFPIKPSQYIGPLLLAVLSFLAFLFEPYSSEYLALQSTWWELGNYYQAISGHFLHTNYIHLAFNVLGVFLLWMLHGDDYDAYYYLIKFLLTCVGVSVLILLFSPEISWYVGLSGAIHGVFAWGCIKDISKGLISGWLLVLGLVLKVGNEQINGAGSLMPGLIEANVAIDSHLYGAVIGIFIGLSTYFIQRYRQAKK